MNSKSTLWLTLLALGLFAYIFLFERHTLDTEQQSALALKLIPDFDAAKVSEVDILRSNNVIRASRVNNRWRLTQPDYPAQSAAIDNWLELFGSLNRRAFISAQELLEQPDGLQAFGLESPSITVVIQQGVKRIQLRIGAKTPVGEKLYLQEVGSEGAYVTDSALLDRLPPSATAWRDPTFLNLTGLKFDRLNIRAGNRELEFQRTATNQLWRLTKPRSARADSGQIQQLLQQLQTLRVNEFVSDNPGGDLETFGLQTPEVTLTFGRGTNVALKVEFGKSPTNEPARVFARRSSHPDLVMVSSQLLDRLRAPYTDFLDKDLVEFSPAAVDNIVVHAAGTFALERQTNGAWRIVQPYDAPADPALVKGFLDRLNALQIVDLVKEVVTDQKLPDYGLLPPALQYTLRTADTSGGTNQMLAQIDFGSIQTNKIYVRRSDENSVYSTRLEDSLALPQAAFELRDRHIWHFTTNQVTGATIELNGRTYKLQRTGGGQWTFKSGSQGIINPFAMEEAMFRFGQMWSKAWIARDAADLTPYGFAHSTPQLAIELDNGGKPEKLTVEFGSQSPSGGPFALVDLDGGRTVFELPFDIFNAFSDTVRSLAVTP